MLVGILLRKPNLRMYMQFTEDQLLMLLKISEDNELKRRAADECNVRFDTLTDANKCSST